MNSLFLTSNGDPNKIVFRVMDGKAVCYCSHPSVLFCKNCVQMTRNIVNSWDSTPENFFEKDDLIGQTLFHKSRSHLLEIFKVLRSMENKRLDSLLTQIMELQKKDDFEDFGKTISSIANFDELKKIDDNDELDQIGKRSDQNSDDNEQQDNDQDDDQVFEDHIQDEEDEEFKDHSSYEEEEEEEEEVIVLKPSSKKSNTTTTTTTAPLTNTSSAASKKVGHKKATTSSNKSGPIKINIIDGDKDNTEENVDIKVNKKSNEPVQNKKKSKKN